MNKSIAHPHIWIKDIKEDEDISGCYLVKKKGLGTTRAGKPFLNLFLADKTGDLEGKVWDRAETLSSLFQEGHIVWIKGRTGTYRGQIQITVTEIQITSDEMDPAVFLESTTEDIPEMMKSLRKILNRIKNSHLKDLNNRFLTDKDFISLFKKAPAAKNFHHNYLGGLLEHTLSVCELAVQVKEHYPHLDGDLLITGAFLHDIGKIREFQYDIHIDYTDEGRLMGHLVLGTLMVEEKAATLKKFPPELALRIKHLILCHHGEYEFGSPKRPKFLEGMALHLLDDLDAKVNGLGRFMEKDRQDGSWTDFNRLFGRPFLKGNIHSPEEKHPDHDPKNQQQGSLFSLDTDD